MRSIHCFVLWVRRLHIWGPVNKTFPDLCETFTYRGVSTERMKMQMQSLRLQPAAVGGKNPKPELPGSIERGLSVVGQTFFLLNWQVEKCIW